MINSKVKWAVLVLGMCISSGQSLGAAEKETKSLHLIRAVGTATSHTTLPYHQIGAVTHYQVVSPHPTKNPDRNKNRWSGTLVLRLLGAAQMLPKPEEEVTFVASDNYSIQISGADVLSSKILLATHRDGTKLNWIEGGPQLVYPTFMANLPAKFQSDAWWVWYVSAIFVGTPPPIIDIASANRTLKIDLRTLKHSEAKMRRSYPAGQRTNPAVKGSAQTAYVPVKEVINRQCGSFPRPLIIESYTGTRIEMKAPSEGWNLRYSWNGHPISPAFGGPVQLCEGPSATQCIFFVKTIHCVGSASD